MGLEEKARRLLAGVLADEDQGPLASTIEREISLVLNQLDHTRKLHESLHERLDRLELYVGTDILQLEPKYHQSVDEHRSERNALKARLIRIEQERQELLQRESERTQKLEERLLTLMNKVEYLQMDNGDRKDSEEA